MAQRTKRESTTRKTTRIRSWERASEPVEGFFPGALLPLLLWLAVAGFGVTRFANGWIEDRVHESVGESLASAGHAWVDVETSGQRVLLTGSPPSDDAGTQAQSLARVATCDSWFGTRRCPTVVRASFSAVEPVEPTEPVATPSPLPSSPPPRVEAESAAACEASFESLLQDAQIRFASASATLLASSDPLIDRIAQAAADCPGVIRIEGHTDSTGPEEANLALSQARASSVRNALVDRGIAPERLDAVGFGEAEPVQTNGTPVGRAANRRIEFRIDLGGS